MTLPNRTPRQPPGHGLIPTTVMLAPDMLLALRDRSAVAERSLACLIRAALDASLHGLRADERATIEAMRAEHTPTALAHHEDHCRDDPCALDDPGWAMALLAILDAHYPPPR